MVVLSLGQYAALTEDAEMRLDEGDKASEADEEKKYEVRFLPLFEEVFVRHRHLYCRVSEESGSGE